MNLAHFCCRWHECSSLMDSSSWWVPAGLSWAARRNYVLWNAGGKLSAVLSMQKISWDIVCSTLLMQTSKQTISYGINGNLVECVCVFRVILHCTGKCHTEVFEGALVKGSTALCCRGTEHLQQLWWAFSSKNIYWKRLIPLKYEESLETIPCRTRSSTLQ